MSEYRPMARIPAAVDEMTRAYLECAEWCGLDDEGHAALELAVRPTWDKDTTATAIDLCARFLADHESEIGSEHTRAGHDLWLTRNRHGAGFWDGGWPSPAAGLLTVDAHALGTAWVDFDENTETLSIVEG